MSSTRLHHGWAGEGKEIERMGGGGLSEMILERKEEKGVGFK